EKKKKKTRTDVLGISWSKNKNSLKKRKIRRGNGESEKPKPAETIFTNGLAGGFVIDIDEHVFLWMASKVAGEDFYKFLFLTGGILHEPFSHVKPMRSFGTIKSKPVMRTVGDELIQPSFLLRYARLSCLKNQTLS